MPKDRPIRAWCPPTAVASLAIVGAAAALGAPAWGVALVALAAAAVTATAGLADSRRARAFTAGLEAQGRAARAEAESARAAGREPERLLESFPEPLLATDAAGAVMLWNAAMERLTGLGADRVRGRLLEEVFTQVEIARIHAAAREGRAAREQVRLARAEGPRVWEVAACAAGPDSRTGRPVVMTIRDATEESRALQIKTDFVANASHELRTPIASMRMALETLAGLREDDERARPMRGRLFSMLTTHLGRMEEMVRDLLDLSRLESPDAALRIEPAPVSDVAAAWASDFAAACRQRNLTLAFDFDPALARMRTDRRLFSLAISNLIDNATKFAFEGTEVRVVGRPTGDGGARFEVIDQGIGIPLNQQARIFERYYQVDEARSGTQGTQGRRGTGLGLAIVKHAVRRLGGSVKVASVWQRGTTMTVEVPGCIPPT